MVDLDFCVVEMFQSCPPSKIILLTVAPLTSTIGHLLTQCPRCHISQSNIYAALLVLTQTFQGTSNGLHPRRGDDPVQNASNLAGLLPHHTHVPCLSLLLRSPGTAWNWSWTAGSPRTLTLQSGSSLTSAARAATTLKTRLVEIAHLCWTVS